MSEGCGPDRGDRPAPAVGGERPPPGLLKWLEHHRIDWRREAAAPAPVPLPADLAARDAWLADAWDGFVTQLQERIPDFFVIRQGPAALATPPAVVPDRLLGVSGGRIVESRGSVSRSRMGAYLARYYWPYTDPNAVKPWLPQLVTTASGFRPAGIGDFQFPEGVHDLEALNDRRTLERLQSSMRPSFFQRRNAPLLEPRAPEPPDPAPGEERTDRFRERLRRFEEEQRVFRRDFQRFEEARTEWERERARAEVAIRDPRVELMRQRGRRRLPGVRRITALGITLDTGVLPGNLFLSQIAPFVEPYLAPIRQLERAFGAAYVAQPVTAWFYYLVGMGLVPHWRHWALHWGTAVVEDLLPTELDALDATCWWVERVMVQTVTEAAEEARRADGTADQVSDRFRDAERTVLHAVRTVSLTYLIEVKRQRLEHLRFAAEEQSGGRVRLEPETFTGGRSWRLRVDRVGADPLELEFPEQVAYAQGLDADARWMLRAVWPQVRGVTALCNQAGVQVRINAANNRWGGRHPPHSSHRQGGDIDWDLGFAGHWVPNLVQRQGATRQPFSRFFRHEPVEGGDEGPPCQVGIDRLVMWIGVQANLIVGVGALLYGDEPLLDDAVRHLTSRFRVERPARSTAEPEPRSHHNHLHAAYRPDAVQGCADPLVWAVSDTRDLAMRLHRLAVERDADPGFWRKLAGLEQVPTAVEDFLALGRSYRGLPQQEVERHIQAWQAWWRQRATMGRSLLPVWDPSLGQETRDALVCGVGRVVPGGTPT